MRDDRDLGALAAGFGGVEVAAEGRADAQRPEEPAADLHARHHHGSARQRQHVASLPIGIEAAEHGVHRLPVAEVLVRQVRSRELRVGLHHVDQAVRLGVGERPQQRRFDEPEDGQAPAHAERQHDDGGRRQARALRQLAEGQPDVLHGVLDEGHGALIAIRLFHGFESSERDARLAPGLLGREPEPQVVVDVQREMTFDLVREFALAGAVPEEAAQPRQRPARRSHDPDCVHCARSGPRKRARIAVVSSQLRSSRARRRRPARVSV
jgi:hypothetical protein